MKIARKDLQKAEDIIEKLNIDIEGLSVYFPVDLTIVKYDEFGIEQTIKAAETVYGNSYNIGFVKGNLSTKLAYASKSQLISFNLIELISISNHHDLTQEDIDYLASIESYLVPNTAFFKCNCNFDFNK
jgi:hypothetical protein